MSTESVAASVLSTVLLDEPWHDLGLGRRPRGGQVFRRFHPQWRVRLEDSAIQEMVALLSAAHVKAGRQSLSELADLLALYTGGATGRQELWRSLGFPTKQEAMVRLRDGVVAYSMAATEDWPQILYRRLGVDSVPKKQVVASLLVSTVRFTQTAERMIWALRDASISEAG